MLASCSLRPSGAGTDGTVDKRRVSGVNAGGKRCKGREGGRHGAWGRGPFRCAVQGRPRGRRLRAGGGERAGHKGRTPSAAAGTSAGWSLARVRAGREVTRAPGARGKDFASDSVRSGAVVGRGVDQGSVTAGLSGFTPAATWLEGVPAKPRDPGLPQGLRALFLTPWSLEPTLPKRLRVESFANSTNSFGYSQAPTPQTHTHTKESRGAGSLHL